MSTFELYYSPLNNNRSLLYLDDFLLDPLEILGRDTINTIEIINLDGNSITVPSTENELPLFTLLNKHLNGTFEFNQLIINDNINIEINWWDDLLIEADETCIYDMIKKLDQSKHLAISNIYSYCKVHPEHYMQFKTGNCIIKQSMPAETFKKFISEVEHYEYKVQNLIEIDQ